MCWHEKLHTGNNNNNGYIREMYFDRFGRKEKLYILLQKYQMTRNKYVKQMYDVSNNNDYS